MGHYFLGTQYISRISPKICFKSQMVVSYFSNSINMLFPVKYRSYLKGLYSFHVDQVWYQAKKLLDMNKIILNTIFRRSTVVQLMMSVMLETWAMFTLTISRVQMSIKPWPKIQNFINWGFCISIRNCKKLEAWNFGAGGSVVGM